MANYSITYSCGHTLDKQLYGKEAQRKSYIAWAGKFGTCAACAKADKTAVCEAAEAEYDLPVLTGSDKQIAWARALRADVMGEIAKVLDSTRQRAVAAGKLEAYEEQTATVLQALMAKTDARYWIDARDKPALTLMKEIFAEVAR